MYAILKPLIDNIVKILDSDDYKNKYIENNICLNKKICEYPCIMDKQKCKLYIKGSTELSDDFIDKLINKFIELLLIG